MRSGRLVLFAALTAVALVLPATAETKRSGDLVKIKLKKSSGKVRAGETAEFVVKVRNRTRAALTVDVEISANEGGGRVLCSRTISLDSRERRKIRLAVEMPAELAGRRVRLRAQAADAEHSRSVRVKAARASSSLELESEDDSESGGEQEGEFEGQFGDQNENEDDDNDDDENDNDDDKNED